MLQGESPFAVPDASQLFCIMHEGFASVSLGVVPGRPAAAASRNLLKCKTRDCHCFWDYQIRILRDKDQQSMLKQGLRLFGKPGGACVTGREAILGSLLLGRSDYESKFFFHFLLFSLACV